MRIKLPIGIESFEKIRTENYVYIDKTDLIASLLEKGSAATLITRPRRFGKTLAMSMMENFFDINKNSRAHFEGLKISEHTELCENWMNQYPTIFLTLKSVEGIDFALAYDRFKILIAELFRKYSYLTESEKQNPADIEDFMKLSDNRADMADVSNSLYLLMRMMFHYYGKKVILLIDEYDVPLAKADENHYYKEMLDLIRSIFGKTLKTNEYLNFAVITGCLRIAKESIFTGINNLSTDTIIDTRFDEYIGFKQQDVDKLLMETGLEKHAEEIKQWYDGYRFGSVEVYCPWDVLNYINALQDNPNSKPKNYWSNTSHNEVIYRFLERNDSDVNDKFEILMAGGYIKENICEDLTYDTVESSNENLWSLLYLTGYLTGTEPDSEKEISENGQIMLRIPNEEVKSIFKTAIVEWFQNSMKRENRSELFDALWKKNSEKAQNLISDILFQTISYHDYQESYYHAFMAGLFTGAGYIVESNYEQGLGRPDIVVKDRRSRRAMVIEVKHAKTEDLLDAKCREALKQIEDKRYMDGIEKGYYTRIGYGVAFCEKECRIEMAYRRSV